MAQRIVHQLGIDGAEIHQHPSTRRGDSLRVGPWRAGEASDAGVQEIEEFHTSHGVNPSPNRKPERDHRLPADSRPRSAPPMTVRMRAENVAATLPPSESRLQSGGPARSDGDMGIDIRRIHPDEADTLRRTRLTLLTESPSAFGSTLERERAFTDEMWAERATSSSNGSKRATFLAFDGDDAVGIVGAGRAPGGAEPVVELVSMWTAPATRRSGLGRKLVEAVFAWATEIGALSVELWVARGNGDAHRLYESMGFVVTGDHQPVPSDPCKDEVRMSRPLSSR